MLARKRDEAIYARRVTDPGWYQDSDPNMLRWWDGTEWTEHRREISPPTPPPPAPIAPTAASPARFSVPRGWWWVAAAVVALALVAGVVSNQNDEASEVAEATVTTLAPTTSEAPSATTAPPTQGTQPAAPSTSAPSSTSPPASSQCDQDVAAAASVSRYQDTWPDLFPALRSCASVAEFVAATSAHNDGRWPEPLAVQPNLVNLCDSAMWPGTPVDSPVCSEVLESQSQTSTGCVVEQAGTAWLSARLSPQCFKPWTFEDGDDPVVWCRDKKLIAIESLYGAVPLNDAARASDQIDWDTPADLGLDADTKRRAAAVADELCGML